MKILCCLLALMLVGCTSTAEVALLVCRQIGVPLANQGAAVHVFRKGDCVIVGRDGNRWTYKVTVENDSRHFRAMRISPSCPERGELDAVIGGELFVFTESGETRLYITAANASIASSEASSYACKDA